MPHYRKYEYFRNGIWSWNRNSGAGIQEQTHRLPPVVSVERTLLLFRVSSGYRKLVPGAGMAMLSDGRVVARKCPTSWKMYRNLGMPRFGSQSWLFGDLNHRDGG
jgi:hypothetical protein